MTNTLVTFTYHNSYSNIEDYASNMLVFKFCNSDSDYELISVDVCQGVQESIC